MKYVITTLFIFIGFLSYGQRLNPHQYDYNTSHDEVSEIGANLTNDTTIDINFYNIDLEIMLDSAYLTGNVRIAFTVLVDNFNQFKLDLDSAYTVDSISFPATSFTFIDNVLSISLSQTYSSGQQVELSIYYKGEPILAGGYKGLRYETHDDNEVIIASLSTPYLAHTWWPCKDGTQDKSDSTFIDITIKDTLVNSIPVSVVSNGILDTIIDMGNRKQYCWKHRYPIVPYYVMVAISNYVSFQQVFNGEGYSFPIDYYVFTSHLSSAQEGVAMLPDVIDYFTQIFGPYPFKDEKYGMTQLGYYGAIENQTNTITNNMSIGWLNISVHELAHMWFADMITCNTWHHGWLNEGFASYSEALFEEYFFDNYHDYIEEFEFYQGGSVYLEDVSNPFDVFRPIIYNKGAYVLHMLRGVVGDSVFFDILYEYATDENFMYHIATTEQFQYLCEDISGMDLNFFFDQWIYDEYYPIYGYNFQYNDIEGNIGLVIKQTQLNLGWREVFEMPMQVKLIFMDGTDSIVNIYNSEIRQEYIFDIDKEIYFATLDPNDWVLKNANYDPSIIVGNNELESDYITIYPNPSKGRFVIDGNLGNTKVKVFDSGGRIVFTSNTDIKNSTIVNIDELEAGIYTIVLINNEKTVQQKIIIYN